MPEMLKDGLLVWGQDQTEWATIEQAAKTARMPFVEGHVALMPDAHVGIGSTVGSVIPTKGAIIPAAIGVDIGCGMAAVKFDLKDYNLPDLENLMPAIEKAIPAGVGIGNDKVQRDIFKALGGVAHVVDQDKKLRETAAIQCGTLGSGNHFFEICVDENKDVWIVLHSGSRGVGNKIAKFHIEGAKGLMKKYFIHLEDRDLAYFTENTPEFDAYIHDMLWAQDYAMLNRSIMLDNSLAAFTKYMFDEGGVRVKEVDRINCHHNFTQRENIEGKNLWITRKGAIKANTGDRGIIPGSMGTATYIVNGLGNPSSYHSCSHGAGRLMSRSDAKRRYSADDLINDMDGKVWNKARAASLVDEIPQSYKDIDLVMEAQKDLVSVEHVLHQVFNYKG